MKLSLKHIAIFGRVIVDVNRDGSFYKTIDLFSMYRDGWFITERFGSKLCMCKKSSKGFMNRFYPFKTEVNINTLDLLWKPIADKQFEKYRKILCENNRKPYTKKRVNTNEN